MTLCPPLPTSFDISILFQRHSAVCTGPKGGALCPLRYHGSVSGSKRGKATVSPTPGFDGRKRDKPKCALHLPIQIRHQQPQSQTEECICCLWHIMSVSALKTIKEATEWDGGFTGNWLLQLIATAGWSWGSHQLSRLLCDWVGLKWTLWNALMSSVFQASVLSASDIPTPQAGVCPSPTFAQSTVCASCRLPHVTAHSP